MDPAAILLQAVLTILVHASATAGAAVAPAASQRDGQSETPYDSIQLSITELRLEQPSVSLQLDLDGEDPLSPLSHARQNDEWRDDDATADLLIDVDEDEEESEDEKCPAGFVRYKNSCYHLVDGSGEMTWHVANTYCQLKDSGLVEIQSEGEQQFVETLVAKYPHTSAYWLGGTNRKGRGLWEWDSSGQPMDFTLWVSQWSSWAYEIDSGSCAVLDASEANQWMFWPCQHNFYMGGERHDQQTGIGFICEKRSPRPSRRVRHRKRRRRRRQKRKGRRRRWFQRLLAQTALMSAV